MSLCSKATRLISIAGPALAAPVQCPPTLAVTETATAVPQGMQAFDATKSCAVKNDSGVTPRAAAAIPCR